MSTWSDLSGSAARQYAALSPSSRLMAALLLIVVLVCTFWSINVLEQTNKVFVLGALNKEQIQKLQTAFAAEALDDYEVVGNRIKVPARERSIYVQAAVSGGAVPHEPGEVIDEALTPGFFESPSNLSRRFQVARERELEDLLCKRPQIDFAAVEIDEARARFGQPPEKTCCIQVHRSDLSPIDRSVLRSIFDTALGYIAGLDPSRLRVIDIGASYTLRVDDDQIADVPLLQAKGEWEDYYRKKAYELLDQYGDIKLLVEVQLDPLVSRQIEKVNYDPSSAGMETVSRLKRVESTPRLNSQDDASVGGLNQPAIVQTEIVEEVSRKQFAQENTITKTAGLTPTSVSFSIGIPESHFRRVHQQRQQLTSVEAPGLTEMPSPEKLAAIENEVTSAVELAIAGMVRRGETAQETTSRIHVYSYTDFPLALESQPQYSEQVMGWFRSEWDTVALLGLAFVCALVPLSWLRQRNTAPKSASTLASATDEDSAAAQLARVAMQTDPLDGRAATNPLGDAPVADVHEDEVSADLSKLVKDNPQATADVLKRWLGEAA